MWLFTKKKAFDTHQYVCVGSSTRKGHSFSRYTGHKDLQQRWLDMTHLQHTRTRLCFVSSVTCFSLLQWINGSRVCSPKTHNRQRERQNFAMLVLLGLKVAFVQTAACESLCCFVSRRPLLGHYWIMYECTSLFTSRNPFLTRLFH